MRDQLWAAALLLVLAPAILAACGGSSSFPPVAACASPSPLSTPSRGDPSGERAYRARVQELPDRLTKMVSDFRARWPEGKFSRQSDFRTEFATMADNSACLAAAARALSVPNSRFAAFDETFDSAIAELEKVYVAARAGVGQRNVSDYRDWDRTIDSRIDAIRATLSGLPLFAPPTPTPTRTPPPNPVR